MNITMTMTFDTNIRWDRALVWGSLLGFWVSFGGCLCTLL